MIALDTNVLVYSEGLNDEERQRAIKAFLRRFDPDRFVIPVQVLGELHRVLVRKGRRSPSEARAVVLSWSSQRTSPVQAQTMNAALECSAAHDLQIWDAVIICSAAEAGARVLLSEDMHHGFVWNGLTVVNPFEPEPYEDLLAPYLMRNG